MFTTIDVKNDKGCNQTIQLSTTDTSAIIGLHPNQGVLDWATGKLVDDSEKTFKNWGLDPKKVTKVARETIYTLTKESVDKVNALAKKVLSKEEEKELNHLLGELSWTYKSNHFPNEFQQLFKDNLCGDLLEG